MTTKIAVEDLSDRQKHELLMLAAQVEQVRRHAHLALAHSLQQGPNSFADRLAKANPELAEELGGIMRSFDAAMLEISEASDAEEVKILGIAPSTSTVN